MGVYVMERGVCLFNRKNLVADMNDYQGTGLYNLKIGQSSSLFFKHSMKIYFSLIECHNPRFGQKTIGTFAGAYCSALLLALFDYGFYNIDFFWC